MLRTRSYRTPGAPFAGEPEAWDPRTEMRRRPAPWHTPYTEERTGASDYARRSPRRSTADHRRTTPRSEYRGMTNVATAEDFRNLARSIEELRTRREPAPEPVRSWRGSTRSTSWTPTTARAGQDRGGASGWAAPSGRPATGSYGTEGRLGSLAREVSDAVSKADVRRLERLLNEVLQKLDAIESGRTHGRSADEPRARETDGAARGTWTVRRAAERRGEERRPEERRADERRADERRQRESDGAYARTASRRRRHAAETPHPRDFMDDEPSPARAAPRSTRPRRLFS